MKRVICLLCSVLTTMAAFAQSYNTERVAMTNYLVRMYKAAPFEGVRVVDDYENQYLISVLSLDKTKYKAESTMNRVASVKAISQASRFFNGSRITSDLIIRTNEKVDGSSDTEVIETINENAVGYVKALERLTNFPKDGTDEVVFIYGTPIQQNQGSKKNH